MVICSVGSITCGLRYWMDYWQQTKRALSKDQCQTINNICVCDEQKVYFIPAKGRILKVNPMDTLWSKDVENVDLTLLQRRVTMVCLQGKYLRD